MEQAALPTHAASTIDVEFGALQEAFTAQEPHAPDGVPYDANRILSMVPVAQNMDSVLRLISSAQKGEESGALAEVVVFTSASASAAR
jgi:hypothetical protein